MNTKTRKISALADMIAKVGAPNLPPAPTIKAVDPETQIAEVAASVERLAGDKAQANQDLAASLAKLDETGAAAVFVAPPATVPAIAQEGCPGSRGQPCDCGNEANCEFLHRAKPKLPKVAKVLAKKAAAKAAQETISKLSVAELKPAEAAPLPVVELTPDSKAALDRALAGPDRELTALEKAHAQMSDDGCPTEGLTLPQEKRGKFPAVLGGTQKSLPRSAPGRELAVPTPTPQTKAEAEKAARKLGLSINGKAERKAKPGEKPRAQYAWKDHEAAAQRGTMPPKLDFSADTHTRFRPTLAKIEAAAAAGDVKALRAIEINPVSSSPKAMIRWRDMCVAALSASGAKASPAGPGPQPAKAKPATKAKAKAAKPALKAKTGLR